MYCRALKTLEDQFLQLFSLGGEFHHGDCIGADAMAHQLLALWREAFVLPIQIHVHPGHIENKRAFCPLKDTDVVYPVKNTLDRNVDIALCEVVLACPKGFDEELRSGTWTTVRSAREIGSKIIIIWPDGMKTIEESTKVSLE